MPRHEMTATVLEAYVLAETDAQRTAILAHLPQGCEAWYELELAERFRSGRGMEKETEELVTSFENAFHKAAEQWRLRWLVLRAGKLEEGSDDQKKAIKELMPQLGIRFNHANHSPITGTSTSGATAAAAPSVLPPDASPEESAVELFQSGNHDAILKLPVRLVANVDFRKLIKDGDFLYFVRSRAQFVPGLATNTTLTERLLSLLQQSKEASSSLQELLPVLSLEQLSKLGEELPQLLAEPGYVLAIMQRRFPDAFDPEAKDIFTMEERLAKLMEVAEFTLNWKSSGPSHTLKVLLSHILLEVLQLHVQMNRPDKKVLMQYLEVQCKWPAIDAKSVPSRLDRVQLPLICSTVEALGLRKPVMDQPLVREHLRAFALEDEFWSAVTPLVPVTEHVLKRFHNEAILLSGKQLKLPEAADSEWLQELSQRSSLTLSPHNKERFEPDEAVKLAVRLKNVPQLVVRIYEINAESYYVHHQRPFTSDVSLDGIGATMEIERSFEHAPMVEHEEELSFEQLAGKQGVFVLDLIGADLRARAVVHKGTLSLIHHATPDGHVAYVLAPDRSVVQSGAKLCLEGRWYESDPDEDGRIIIPYGQTKQRLKIIIAARGMAHLSEFERFKEQYKMVAAHVLVNESVVMGQNAKVLIQPKLSCCGRSCDLQLIKKAQVTISMRCGSESVPTVRTFSDVTWEMGNIHVEFLVPPKLKSIEAALQIEVFNRSKQEVEKLHSTRRWAIDDLSSGIACFDLFLSRPRSGFEVRCLGKDGEPRPGMTVALTMHGLVPSDSSLVTDAEGSVHLGPLDGVQRLVATVAGVVRCWALPPLQKVVYPSQLDILEGENMELPLLEGDVACVRLVQLVGAEDHTLCLQTSSDKITVEASRSSSGLGSVTIKALQRGGYRLLIGDQSIQIKVHRGQKWHDDYVLRSDAIVEHTDRQRVLAVKSAKAGPDGVAVELHGSTASTKVHIFGLRFLPSDLLDVVQQLVRAEEERSGTARFPFQGCKNVFHSNVKLADEIGYVLRRRKATAQVGNLLKRPNLLMQPRAVQETSFQEEMVVTTTNQHMQAEACAAAGRDYARKPVGFKPAALPRGEVVPECCSVERLLLDDGHGPVPQGSSSVQKEVVQGIQNFLKAECIVAWNQLPNEDGQVGVHAHFSQCNSVLVVVVDKGSVTHCLVPVGEKSIAIASRGLTLAEPLAQDGFFLEKRTATALKAGAAIGINDQASVEWRAVDSVERLMAFYKAICPEHLEQTSAWSLETWDKLDFEAKARIWSAHACHELHLFIYMKDRKFFNDVVMPFVRSKMEKDVVDWYLMGDAENLKQYLPPAIFQALNPLEKVLVLRSIASKEDLKAHCQKLVLAMQAQANALSTKRRSATRKNALLDSVLGLEAVDQTDDESDRSDELEGADDEDVAQDAADFAEDPEKEEERKAAASSRDRARSRSRDRNVKFKLFSGKAKEKAPARRRKQWEEVDATKECVETQYLACTSMAHRTKPSSEDYTLSEFWSDAASHALEAGADTELLLSPNFIFATSSPHEVLAAIALTDLPLTAEKHKLVSKEGLSASFEAASPCLFVAKEIVAVPAPDADSDLRVAVRVYKATADETTSKDPRAVAEFVAGEAYCLQAITTNVSPKEVEAQVLTQIPEGAIPLADSAYTSAQAMRLSAFACSRTKVCFYFPRAGRYSGAPVHCSVSGKAAAASDAVVYNVVNKASTPEVQSFSDILASGEDAVLKFLQDADILGGEKGFSFRQLHALLRSSTFFAKALATLRARCVFDRSVWEYGFMHGDASACKELLAVASNFQQKLGPFFESPLVSVTAVDAEVFHLEYHPLVNKRAHRLSESAPRILNDQLRKTYEKTILALARKCRALDSADELRLSHYLLCQDRIHEAKVLYSRAAAKQSSLPTAGDLLWQLDYMTAYFDLFDPSSDHSAAHRIADTHRSCPHVQWRARFQELASVLAESTGAEPATAGAAASEPAPALSASLHKSTLEIEATGLTEITVKLFCADLEMLFSRMPFIKADSLHAEFSFVKPIFEVMIPGSSETWQIPEEFRNMDLAVELVANNALRVFQMHYATGLRVAVAEQYGYLTATNADGTALPATYVKVFSRVAGSEKFFKDGYTDLRGRFDYASLSGESAAKVERFAMLVASAKLGGVVREAPPPKRSESCVGNFPCRAKA